MTTRLRVAALALALAACGKSSKSTPGLLLNEPSGVAVFRGLTSKTPDLHPYLAIANAATNELTIVDAVDDSLVPAPVALRPLVYPVPGRPALVASADLRDGKADLLVAVSAGDSKLQVIRTWTTDGDVVNPPVDLGADVVALVAVPSAPGSARIAAALAGERLAIVTFTRSTSGDANAIDVEHATVTASIPLGFQPVALAVIPGDQSRVWAATRDVDGVVAINVDGTPTAGSVLDARAPTRLVAAALLWEPTGASTSANADAFDLSGPRVSRVYAILDESGCGPRAPIACGLVALDPDSTTTALAPDPTPEGSPLHAPFRAPIPIPGAAVGLAAAQPPAVLPPDLTLDPSLAGSVMRMVTAAGTRITTAAAAVASTDGHVYFVDLGRWEIPGEQQPVAPTATTSAAVDPEAFVTNLRSTPGYTPDATWTATWQGELPGLVSRRAESGGGTTTPLLALQANGGSSEVVRVYDAALGIRPGDIVVIDDPSPAETCPTTFEAIVIDLLAPDAQHPGGAMQLGTSANHPEWRTCVNALNTTTLKSGLRASVRAGEWVLVRGTGVSAVEVGRPGVDEEFLVQWQEETGLSCATTCGDWTTDPTCRQNCETLLRARLARRIGYVPLGDAAGMANPQGPALAFTLKLRPSLPNASRGFTVPITTTEGRSPFRVVPPGVTAVAPGDITVFDRSTVDPANTASAGVRFLVPYLSNVVLDATPTVKGGDAKALH